MTSPETDINSTRLIGSPTARLDRLPTTPTHIFWILILGMGYLIETFDNTVFSYLAPSIRSEWNLSIESVGLVSSAVFVGMMIGAIGGGRLSDRVGRKPVLIWGSVFYSATSLMSALAPNFEILLLSRILTGIGVQAATGVIMVYVSEMFPRLSRGRFFAVMTSFGFIASPIASFTALAIAPTGVGAWRWVFALGTVGVFIAVAVAVGLPETVRWLALKGREAQAATVVERLEAKALRRGELAPIQPESPVVKQGSFRELFKPQYLQRVTVLGLTFAGLIFCLYGFVSWMPTVLVGRGMTKTEALSMASIITLGSITAGPIIFLVADRIERKTALLVEGLIGGAALVTFGFATDHSVMIIAGFVAQFALSANSTTFYTYIPEVFPTEVRGVGAGTVNGFARIAGIASGILVAAMYAHMGATLLYLILGIGLVLVGLGAFRFGPRTTRRSLETISPE
ncbi:MFS transporter [Rhodococcus sp. NPDC059968]|uniref:MFS transporter n=1 Tax=Rhodococcus sp. NPDC059968 TaxID=3347017 RepID=UPI00366D80AC